MADLPADFWKTHTLRAGYTLGGRVRLDEVVPAKCDYKLTNPEAIEKWGGTKPHNWMHWDAVFPHEAFPHAGTCVYKDLPNWGWCNNCGLVDPTWHGCEAHVMNNYSSGACDKHAKYEHAGKWYCGTHEPVRVAAKRAARDAAYAAQRQLEADARDARRRAKERQDELIEVALEMVQWMDASGIHNDDEWANQLYRRVKKLEEE